MNKKTLITIAAIGLLTLTGCAKTANQAPKIKDTTPSSSVTKEKTPKTKAKAKITDRTDPRYSLEDGVPDLKSDKLTKEEQEIFDKGETVEDMALLKKFATQYPKQDQTFQETVLRNNDDAYEIGGYFRSQYVNRNPWYWIYLMRNTRNRYQDDEGKVLRLVGSRQYLRGYLDAFADGQKGQDHTNDHERKRIRAGVYRTTDEHLDYVQGYKDGLTDYEKN